MGRFCPIFDWSETGAIQPSTVKNGQNHLSILITKREGCYLLPYLMFPFMNVLAVLFGSAIYFIAITCAICQVVQYWAEKGVSGFTVFKYRLRRLEGQPILTTNQVTYAPLTSGFVIFVSPFSFIIIHK